MTYEDNELDSFLADIDSPVLTSTYRDKPDAPIAVKEVWNALEMLLSGKTPGTDRIPVEFYKAYTEDLLPCIPSMLVGSLATESLLFSMSEVVIAVIPKPGKDPSLCFSYRPISLLNVDAKLSKILAS